ncbi:MAG TPA: glutathione S-transferase C-terminal domain-containing protein [Caulobacterales bacterium]|jgi:glutathione S-transferase|nr:glutathione S-transferase C-terminal domain-containing protein [Caulobacterales bacterium]
MRLFYSPGSCSLAPHIVLRELGLDIPAEKVTLGPQRTTASGEDYYKINPKGAVPALEISPGEVLTENAVILQYLAGLKPGVLLPESGLPRFRVLEAVNFVSTELHKSFSPLFAPNMTPEWRAGQIEYIKKKLALFETVLGDKDYLTGQFSLADAYAFAVLRWTDKQGVTLSPKLAAYRGRVGARTKVQQAMEEQGLLQKAA